MARWHSCNVLQVGRDARHLWQFSAGGDKFTLQREESKQPNEALPAKLVSKDWQSLFQPKLNIAWLPTDKIFLRVVQLPKSDFVETQSMVELQLEKLSPLPVAQVVWSFELLPQTSGEMQTAIVVIVARQHVEEFLGLLEGQGYLADRLELPLLDQIRATHVEEDGAWIYPGVGADNYSCLVAWWYGGVLWNLCLVHLPSNEKRGELLREQLAQMTWAGELEGWLSSPPRYHVVADASAAAAWTLLFSQVQEQPVDVVPPLAPPELAALTSRRAASQGLRTSLLPSEYAARYRQQLVDRLWMRGFGALLVCYVFGVAIYFGWAQVAKWRYNTVASQVASLGLSYTNALQLRERVKVLQDQLDLQFAALECWKATAELLPDELTLVSFNFDRGRKFTLFGTVATEDASKVQEFNEKFRKVAVKDQPLFKNVNPPNMSTRQDQQVTWNFSCDLRRTDTSE